MAAGTTTAPTATSGKLSTTPAGHAAGAHPLATQAAGSHPLATHAAIAHAAVTHAAAAHAHVVTKVVPPAPPAVHTSLAQDLQTWALNWEPVVAILFFVVIIAVMWRMLKVMPKVKPQQ